MNGRNLSAADILKLDVSERLLLVEDIWDSIRAFPQAIAVTPAQKKELDRRLARYHANPTSGSPWDSVRKRIRRAG